MSYLYFRLSGGASHTLKKKDTSSPSAERALIRAVLDQKLVAPEGSVDVTSYPGGKTCDSDQLAGNQNKRAVTQLTLGPTRIFLDLVKGV